LGYHWRGYRKVHRTVCKRLNRRLRELDLAGLDEYRARLEGSPAEWTRLDAMCRIPISRFVRDRMLFDALARELLPALAHGARRAGRSTVEAWSAGCASGEEPYSLAIAWRLAVPGAMPSVSLAILATDIDPTMLARARTACYPPGALRDLPPEWRRTAFEKRDGDECLTAPFRLGVTFRQEDIREMMPPGPFDLILCRNLAFTYFDAELERRILRGVHQRLRPGGLLVVGAHERPPQVAEAQLERISPALPCYRRPSAGAAGG
jgi:chemotaxis protein methyltransferase CheR